MSTGKPYLVMLIEPETKIRFRYASEKGCHGGLLGKQKEGEKKKIYPTLKLKDYHGNKRVSIKATLYTEDKEPHFFEFRGETETSTPYVLQDLAENDTAIFTNLRLLCKKKDEICSLLMDRRMEKLKTSNKIIRAQLVKKHSKEDKERAKDIMNSVRLCFEAFDDEDERLCEPLFSDPICNQKAASKGELRIHRMSRISGSWRGGDDIILLCDKIQKDNIEIQFYEIDNGEKIWKEKGIFLPADVHYQVAIPFKTPKFRKNTEKTVFVCLFRDGEFSDSLEYTYQADNEGIPCKKRKHATQEDLITSSGEIHNEDLHIPNSEMLTMAIPVNVQQEKEDDNLSMETTLNLDILKDLDIEQYLQDCIGDLGYRLPFDDLSSLQDIPIEEIEQNDSERIYNQSYDPCQFKMSNIQFDGVAQAQMAVTLDKFASHSYLLKSQNINRRIEDSVDGTLDGGFPDETKNDSFYGNSINSWNANKRQLQKKIYVCLMKRDFRGNTLLHVAVNNKKGFDSILFMAQFANVDIINERNCNQETALHLAIRRKNMEAIKTLLENGCNPNLKDSEGNNCYHMAILDDNALALNDLLMHTKYMPQYNAFNFKGLTPLHIAVCKNAQNCYHLLKKSPYVDSMNFKALSDQNTGRSLLHYAVEFQDSFVTILLDEGEIKVNIQDNEGNTPLHLACAFEKIEVVKQLLKAGASPHIENFKQNRNNLKDENSDDDDDDDDNIQGQTPSDLTTNLEILELLKQTSNNSLDESIEKLCQLLNKNMKWKEIALYVLDEKHIKGLEWNPNGPSKALLQHIQREKEENFMEYLKNIFEMTDLKEALEIIEKV